MNPNSPMRTFDPRTVAHYEKESWIAYYKRRWLRLMRLLVALVQSTFGLSFFQAIYAGYLLTRAQIAFAPKDNNAPLAEEHMRRFFAYLQRIHRENFDVAQAAHLEVNWWVVHRRFFGHSENPELVDALGQAYAAAYHVAPESVQEAALHRARAMVYSDRWVNDGCEENSPLLAQEEDELLKSYTSLRRAVGRPL